MPVHRTRTSRDGADPTTARVTFAERLEMDNAAYRRAAAEARGRAASGASGEPDVSAMPGTAMHDAARSAAASLRVPLGIALGDIPEASPTNGTPRGAPAGEPGARPRVEPLPVGSIIDLLA